MSRVVELSGAQVLPSVNDARAVTSAWFAVLATNADLRTAHPSWAEVASNLRVVR